MRKAVFSILAVAWAWVAYSMVRDLAEEVPNVIRLRLFSDIVVWTVATHLITVLAVPWAGLEFWRGRDRAFVIAMPVMVNVFLNYAFLWWVLSIAPLEIRATLYLAAATLTLIGTAAVRVLLTRRSDKWTRNVVHPEDERHNIELQRTRPALRDGPRR